MSTPARILYNVTVKIDRAVHDEWLDWMQRVHIPDVMATGLFLEYKICRLLHTEDEDGITYAIQYLCPDMAALQRYQREHAPRLQEEHSRRYRNRYVAFRTLMEVLPAK